MNGSEGLMKKSEEYKRKERKRKFVREWLDSFAEST